MLIGYSKEEYENIKANYLDSLIYPDDKDKLSALIKNRKIEDFNDKSLRLIKKDKSLIWVKVNISPFTVKGQSMFALTLLDITNNKGSESQDKSEKANLNLALDKTNTAVFEMDINSKAFYCSGSFDKYAFNNLVVKGVIEESKYESYVDKADIPTLKNLFKILKNQKERSECVLHLLMKDNTYSWTRVVIQVIKDSQKKPIKIVGTIMDIDDEVDKSFFKEELLSNLSGNIGIYKIDSEESECLYYSQALVKPNSLDQIDTKDILSLNTLFLERVLDIDKKDFTKEVIEKIKTGLPVDFTFRLGTSEDNTWIHLRAEKIKEIDNCPVYLATCNNPPRESTVYQNIVEDSITSILVIEQKTNKIIYVNHSFLNMVGKKENESLLGRNFTSIFSEETSNSILDFIKGLESGRVKEITIKSHKKEALYLRGKIISWTLSKAVLLYFRNQTDIQKKNADLTHLLNAIPTGIGIYNIEKGHSDLAYLNKSIYKMLGYDEKQENDQLIGDYRSLIHPDDLKRMSEESQKLVDTATSMDVSYRIRNNQGDYVWFRLIGNVEKVSREKKLIYCAYFNIDKLMKTQIELNNEKQMLQLAIKTGKLRPWKYDLISKTITQDTFYANQLNEQQIIRNVPESLIKKGFVHPDSVSTYRKFFTESAKDDGIVSMDVRVKSPDNIYYAWERVIMTPVFDENGKHTISLGTTIDITEQKNMEAKYLQQLKIFNSSSGLGLISKSLYNLTTNTTVDFTSDTSNITNGQKTYDEQLAYVSSLFSNQNEAVIFQQKLNRSTLIENLIEGKSEIVFDYRRKTVSGKIVWVRLYQKLFIEPERGDTMAFIYSYDIDDQKLTQEMMDTVIKTDYDYLALLDCKTKEYVVFSNDTDNLNNPLPPFHSSSYEKEVANYAKANLIEEDIERNIHEMSLANLEYQLTRNPIYTTYVTFKEIKGVNRRKKLQFSYLDPDQERILITRTDITDIYKREQSQLKKIQDANNIKTEFLSHMSHDLRTPMNAIIGLSDLAEDEIDSKEATVKYISQIKTAAQFLLGLVDDCLDFEKLSEHKMILHNAPYSYQAFHDDITLMIAPPCAQKNLKFNFADHTDYEVINVDKVRFQQIFFNLLSNSVKYTPEGGQIDFIVNTKLIDKEKNLLACDFIVKDNGIGMSKEFLKKIYLPFEQEAVSNVTSQGTGLGLTIVKDIISLMNGTIKVESEPNKGTTTYVHLEVEIADPKSVEDDKVKNNLSPEVLKGKRILLLEDQPLNLLIAQKLLEKKGMQVTSAVNGKIGLDIFTSTKEGTFSAILTDIRMPIMDGLAFGRAIRSLDRKDAKNIPIIAMTANAFEEDIQESLKAGMNAHLSKPINPDLLYKTLESFFTSDNKKLK